MFQIMLYLSGFKICFIPSGNLSPKPNAILQSVALRNVVVVCFPAVFGDNHIQPGDWCMTDILQHSSSIQKFIDWSETSVVSRSSSSKTFALRSVARPERSGDLTDEVLYGSYIVGMASSFKIRRALTASYNSSLLKSLRKCSSSKCSEHTRAVFALYGSTRQHRDIQSFSNPSSLGNLWKDKTFPASSSLRQVFLQLATAQFLGIAAYNFKVSTKFGKHAKHLIDNLTRSTVATLNSCTD